MANTENPVLDNQTKILHNQATLESNQHKILGNQEGLETNQKTIIDNQEAIKTNQASIVSNQEVIVDNQASIITNQKQIVENQSTLDAILQSQAYILNLVKKLSGQEESLEATTKFLEKLKGKSDSKTLASPQSL